MRIYDFPKREITLPIYLVHGPTEWRPEGTRGMLDFYYGGADVKDPDGNLIGHVSGTNQGYYQISIGEYLFWIPPQAAWEAIQGLITPEQLEALKKDWRETQEKLEKERRPNEPNHTL